MSNKNVNVELPSLLPTLLTILFAWAKLTGRIDWSWWWVLSPIWIAVGLALVIAAVVFAIAWVAAR